MRISSDGVWSMGLSGAETVPWQCWEAPGFKAKHDAAFAAAQKECSGNWGDAPEDEKVCVDKVFAQSLSQLISECSKASSGNPCSSAANIKKVQAAIGTTVDGKWGPKSQAALDKSGKTFISIAGACTPPVPGGSTGTTGGGVVKASPPKTTPATPPSTYSPPAPTSLVSKLTSNPLAIGGVALAAVVVVAIITKKSKGGKGKES